ncbi:MAG: hypothetical protein D8H94_07915 [Cardiobacterium sp.]|nr:MAG: hypothetical protein D8H94_07915 [Cardiobacterium sp.]
MKKGFFLPLLLLAAAAQAADDDARRCDLAGASFLDPQRPPAVAFRYFHPVYADVAAVNADAEACQRAYDQSKDPRYLYQAGNVYAGYFDEGSVRFAIGKMRESDAPAPNAFALYDAKQSMRDFYQRAADAGYAAARYGQAWAVRYEPDSDSRAVFEALMPEAPLLAHLGLADGDFLLAMTDSAREDEHRAAAERHFREAVALNADVAALDRFRDKAERRAVLEASVAQHPNPFNQSRLAGLYYAIGETEKGNALFATLQAQAADNPDAQTAVDYLLGLRRLNGWGMAVDKTGALTAMKKAMQGGYPDAVGLVFGMERAQ